MRARSVHLAPTTRAALALNSSGQFWMMLQPWMKPWCSAAVADENPLSVFRLAPSTWAAAAVSAHPGLL